MKTKTMMIGTGLALIAIIAAGTVIGMNLTSKNPETVPTVPTHYLNADNNGTTICLKKGDSVNLTLPDYGDGGYTWSITKMDNTMLRQDRQFTWGSSGMLGDFGKDTWLFTALQTGNMNLELVCSRPFDQHDICQTFVVELQIE
jgi:predicted secreted protein